MEHSATVDGSPASILVVCNPEDAAELAGVLEGEALPVAGVGGRVVRTDGGDETIARFVELRPEVVVITANLDAGDARALISALRNAVAAGTFHIVLVGDSRGPIRNALDAADFGADRFVARPIAPKALRFAVGSGVAAARRARSAIADAGDASAAPVAVLPDPSVTRVSGMQRARMITSIGIGGEDLRPADPHGATVVRRAPTASSRLDEMLDAAVEDVVRDEVVRRTSTGFSIPMDAILAAGGDLDDAGRGSADPMNTAPMSVHEVPTRPLEGFGGPPAPVTIQPRRARATPQVITEALPHVEPPPPMPFERDETDFSDVGFDESGTHPVGDDGAHTASSGLDAPVLSETAGSFDEPPDTRSAGADDWDAPPIPVREPTLILGDGASAPPPAPVDLDVTERRGDGGWGASSAVAPLSGDGADDAAGRADDVAEVHDVRPVEPPPPAGGDFARELRRKMSMMAQRLFRQSDVPTPAPVDVRPPHDFRTEIDLAELDEEHADPSEEYDLSAHETFAGDEHGLPTGADAGTGSGVVAPASGHGLTGSSRTAESGEIVRGTADAPVLIARMFVGEFTGKVVFRRRFDADEVAEKVIFFDGGRPVFASSNLHADRMGELLYREGKITAEQYARCRDLVLESGRRMGEILVDRGFLKRRELLPAVRRHVEDIIYSLFAWDAGEYRIVAGDGAQSERIRLSRHPAAMVLEGVRRKIDQATLERLLGPATTVVEVADRDKAGTVISVADLSADERAALTGMDGSADLAHVVRTSGATLLGVYQLAWALTLLGVATIRRRGGEDDEAPALVGETDLVIDRERVRARHRLVIDADYFALLGVRRDATGFEIRRAYESSCRDFDAESFPPELRTELAVELAEIGSVLEEAYRVLRDDRLRWQYLAHLAE